MITMVYIKEYPYFQKTYTEVKEHGICNLFSNGSEKTKIVYVPVTIMYTHTLTEKE